MRKKVQTSSLLSGILLSSMALIPSDGHAQVCMPNQKSEVLQMREMDAFNNPDVATIPYDGKSIYRQKGEREILKNTFAETSPIETNLVLQNKTLKNRAKANENQNVVKTFDTSWGTFNTIEDNKMYYFTQESEISFKSGYTPYYRSATFTIYDDNLEQIKQFTVNSSDTTQYFRIVNQVSSKVFNSDANWEFAVAIHGFSGQESGPASCRDTICIVNENSEVIRKMGNTGGISINKISSSKYHVLAYRPQYSSLYDSMLFNIYNSKDLGNNPETMPEPIYTEEIPNNLLSYSEGPVFTPMTIEGTMYYVSSYYEKPFVANGDQMNPEWEMNNRFLIKLYNTSFELVKEISLPLIGQQDHPISMSSLFSGFYEYMITQKTFNDDDKFEIVYGMSRYYIECDCEKVDYYLVNEDGEVLKEMVQKTGGTIKLQDIPGQSDEYAVLMGGGDAIEAIKMYRMPEMEEVYTFPALHNGELLSINFERIASNDSYEYIIGLGRGENADNTVYGGIAYYNQEGKMTKRIRVDLGPKAAMFSPILLSSTLNPYSFVADDEMEYLYFSKKYNDNGGIVGGFGIANEKETLFSWEDEPEWNFAGAGVQTNSDMNVLKYLYVSYQKNDLVTQETRFYELPLISVTLQGEGTQQNPYQIGTAAELDLIRENPSAYYELSSDIDMAKFTGVNGTGFNPLPKFTGTLDGKNHVIKNIILNAGNSSTGLFEEIGDGGTVKNLQMENVSWSNYSYSAIGTIVGRMFNGHMDNCHVRFDLTSNEGLNTMGGLVGNAASFSTISNCSFQGNIYVPNSRSVGGIIGQLASSSKVTNSYTTGSIYAQDGVGGITGKFLTDALVENCYSTMDILGTKSIGGIAGGGNGTIQNNYATGKVESDLREDEKWITGAGGIAGSISGSMYGASILTNNLALNERVMIESELGRVAYTDFDETTGENKYLKSNYALTDMLVGPNADEMAKVDESDEITVGSDRIHGKSVTKAELVQTFYEDMGWKFGKDSLNPWVMTDEYPQLWFEFRARGVKLDKDVLTMGVNEKQTLTAEVYPEKAENKNVRYESSDMRVAIVSSTGEVTARNLGTAVIKVITEDGSYTDECTVNVIIPVEKVEISVDTLHLYYMESTTLEATVTPEDATNKNVFWKSLNPGVASASGGIVVGMYPGEAKVVAEAEGGNASDTCTVFVHAPIEDMYLNESSISLDKSNPTFQLEVTIKPNEAAGIPLVWESDNETAATVNDKGLVTAQRKGEAIVTVSTVDGQKSASCLVIVTENVGIENNVQNATAVYAENGTIRIESEYEMESVRLIDAAGRTISDLTVNANQATIENVAEGSAYLVQIKYADRNDSTHKVVL